MAEDKINKIFEVPNEAIDIINIMINKNEKKLINLMGDEVFTKSQLEELIKNNFNVNEQDFIKASYKRSVLDKVKKDEDTLYKTSNVYSRLAVFAQFENDIWKCIDKEIRKK